MRAKGVTPTIQRVAILELLRARADHPTAEEIFRELREKFPTISLATVYNSLELLRKIGEIQQLVITKEKARYDPNPKPHHHFFCRKCERVIDLEISCPFAERGEVEGHKVEAVQACFHGICADCLKKEGAGG